MSHIVSDFCADSHKIFWHQDEQKIRTENYTPMYDGIPYILLGSKLLECQYGIDRNVYQKQKHYANRNVSMNVLYTVSYLGLFGSSSF